jgi:cytochrome c-type biogenesis protein CcmE
VTDSCAATPGPGPRWRGRWPLAALAVVVVAGVTLVALALSRDTLTYYTTPTEVSTVPGVAEGQVRLGGMVAPGSVERDGGGVRFLLTDGVHDVPVQTDAVPPDTFREGQGAIVEGRMGTDGTFAAEDVVVRHSNEYRPPGDEQTAGESSGTP